MQSLITISPSPKYRILSIALLVGLSFLYCAYPLAMSGRTLGMTLFGLRVVRDDGSGLNGRHAIVRVLAFPLSILTLGVGILLILLRRDRCALHDLIADTVVVYDRNMPRPKIRRSRRQSR